MTNVGGRKDAGRANDQLKLYVRSVPLARGRSDGPRGGARAYALTYRMEAFLKHLPDVNITMSHHDGPSVFLDHAMKTKYLDLARAGQGELLFHRRFTLAPF